jgi:hypothetical protein
VGAVPEVRAAEPVWDVMADTWVATDGLGRVVPGHDQVGGPRPDRTVGMFYFLWHGAHVQGGPYDVTRILAQDPEAMTKPDSPLWGRLHVPHHWGESIFGYYRIQDAGVLRKHAQMLGDAGVDVVIFDVTNQITYRDDYLALLREWSASRALGNRTPQVAFLTPFWDPQKVVRELWRDLYQPGVHRDLWFRWEGKPLILADANLLDARREQAAQNTPEAGDRTVRSVTVDAEAARIREFFTFRKPQPDYFQGPTQSNMWSWLEVHPQHVFRNDRGEKEQMSVGVGQNAVGGRLGSMSEPGARGRSFHRGARDMRPGAVRLGLNVSEQWERALKEDPRFIFVTGWNEWIAGRFAEFNRVKLPVMFVDQFDQEHSRDIEPMKGGHGDDYFYQFVGHVRRYKGARAPQAWERKPIQVDASFGDWADVLPEFRDTIGDPVERKHVGWDTNVVYTNTSGRNDIVAAKVSADAQQAWFYVRTRQPLTTPVVSEPWMLLLLDVDGNAATGWLGYDFVVNRSRDGMSARIEKHRGPGWDWQPVGEAELKFAGDQLELAIPWQLLGRDGPPTVLDFKWADQLQGTGEWSDFTLNGDAAPNDRFNYRVVWNAASTPGR